MNKAQDFTQLIKENKSFADLMESLEMPEGQFKALAPLILEELGKIIRENPQTAKEILKESNLNEEDISEILANLEETIHTGFSDYPSYKQDFLIEMISAMLTACLTSNGVNMVHVPIELCHEDAKIPAYANAGDAGMDVYALDDYTIRPGETVLVPTGIKVAVPEGYELQVRPKSGRALKTKLRVANTPGTVNE